MAHGISYFVVYFAQTAARTHYYSKAKHAQTDA